MRFIWDDNKNKNNIQKHGIDFHDGWQIFEKPILERIDNRKEYNEERWIALGELEGAVVVLVYTYRQQEIRIISIRRASRCERKIYYSTIEKEN